MLQLKQDQEQLIAETAVLNNTVVIPPCFIGHHCRIENAIVGPHVAIGNNSMIRNTVISNSIVQNETSISDANLTSSMIGSKVDYQGKSSEISLGDFSQV